MLPASRAGAGWGGGEVGRGRCWLPDWPSPQPSGTLAAFELFLSVCLSIWLREAGWFRLVSQTLCLLLGTLSFVSFYF